MQVLECQFDVSVELAVAKPIAISFGDAVVTNHKWDIYNLIHVFIKSIRHYHLRYIDVISTHFWTVLSGLCFKKCAVGGVEENSHIVPWSREVWWNKPISLIVAGEFEDSWPIVVGAGQVYRNNGLVVPSILVALADISDRSGDELAGIVHTYIGIPEVRGNDQLESGYRFSGDGVYQQLEGGIFVDLGFSVHEWLGIEGSISNDRHSVLRYVDGRPCFSNIVLVAHVRPVKWAVSVKCVWKVRLAYIQNSIIRRKIGDEELRMDSH